MSNELLGRIGIGKKIKDCVSTLKSVKINICVDFFAFHFAVSSKSMLLKTVLEFNIF